MPRNSGLSENEKGKISAFHLSGKSVSYIAKQLSRSRTVVSNFLKDPEGYGAKKRPGRPPKMTNTAKRRLFREASKGQSSSREMQQSLELPVTARRIRQMLNKSPNFVYRRRKTTPALTVRHKQVRVEWVKEKVTWTKQNWENVVFSDEKKFNLDGPDGTQCYWHDLRKEEQLFSKRPFGGGSLMIWGAFSAAGKAELVVMEGRQNSQRYIDVLEKSLLPFLSVTHNNNATFQQDNAAIHTSRVTKNWFQEKNIQVMDWPAKSPDLNPIENLWGILSRMVYHNGRQFLDRESLKTSIKHCWDEISTETLQNLIGSMQTRCTEVLQSKGCSCKY